MKIDKDMIMKNLIFDERIKYSENISLYPVKMENILNFQLYSKSITVPKDSLFRDKKILKMSYLEFIKYCNNNDEMSNIEGYEYLKYCYMFALHLLQMACIDSEIVINENTFDFMINGEMITDTIFDDLRRIIIIQNDIDFDIDEFINKDTLKALEKAREFERKKTNEESDIEDQIDSLVIEMKFSEEYIKTISIRKFWRYIKRINKRIDYQIFKTAECGGMVTFKQPIKHWMTTLEVVDKYSDVKADEKELREKIG